MKKPILQPLIIITALFIGGIGGYFLGFDLNHSLIQPASLNLEAQQSYTLAPQELESLSANSRTERININTATKAELQTLPGVGEVLAGRIVDYRRQNGPFRTVYALTTVEGFGAKRLEAIYEIITVGG